ncbi:MAG TPA: hypothetical protein VLJ16_02020 [Acidobacteriota bacterium]|nr:hypothetical protein [Acidobacteriota bacterium]
MKIRAAAPILVLALPCLVLVTCSKGTDIPTPTPVDVYQDMESGDDGDPLTSTIMNASHHGPGSWDTAGGTLWVSSTHSRSLPGPVMTGGTTYSAGSGTRSWTFLDGYAQNFVFLTLPSAYSRVTVACYLTVGPTCLFWNQFDTLAIEGISVFSVLQMQGEDTAGPYLRAHSRIADGTSTFSPDKIRVVAGKTYWVNLQYDGPAGKTRVAAFDPDNGFLQVGSILVADSVFDAAIQYFSCGRCDTHGDNPDCPTRSYVDDVIIDFTNGVFPLVPGILTGAGSDR